MPHGLPPSLRSAVESQWESVFGGPLRIDGFKATTGGCINNTGVVATSEGPLFLKWNDRARYPRMFELEAKGLRSLSEAGGLQIPQVHLFGEDQTHSYLLTEAIVAETVKLSYWEELGAGLATIHRHSWDAFGAEADNYLGSVPQRNTAAKDWPTFFIEHRLMPNVQRAVDQGELPNEVVRQFEALYPKLDDWLATDEPPSLLHGDLWSGNLMTGKAGNPVLIDPAVYYGHRETEIAFTTLFGRFSLAFYDAYDEAYPLPKGSAERADLYNLYPLLIHVILFGSGYLGQVRQILKTYLR